MGKSVYSIVLSDEIVREIDKMAYSKGMNRSSMINGILAEYASVITPEKLIRNTIGELYDIICSFEGFRVQSPTSEKMLSLQSALAFKYNPTVKYNVELYRMPQRDKIGEIRVTLRSQNAALLMLMNEFCRKWMSLEAENIDNMEYAMGAGRFDRKLINPRRLEADNLGGAIAEYIKAFDKALKDYLNYAGNAAESTDMIYNSYISENGICI